MTNVTTYTPEGQIGNDWRVTGYRVVARVHYADGSSKAIIMPREYGSEDSAMLACVALTVSDQQIAQARADELARLGK